MIRSLRWAVLVFLMVYTGLAVDSLNANEVQVNSYTTNNQGNASVALDADGDFVVVWSSNGSSGSDQLLHSIQGQRFGSNGLTLGGEFQVNTYTVDSQTGPSVAMAADGRFVVVWTSRGSSGSDSDTSVQGQLYLADGTALGAEFQINTYTTQYQGFGSVAMAAEGNFIVVWTSRGSSGTDSSEFSIQGQRYASDGSPVGGEFQVNSYTTDSQFAPSVALGPAGEFVVAWSAGTDTDPDSIQARLFAPDGSAMGDEFQVNTDTAGDQDRPSVASWPNGDFVVVWSTFYLDLGVPFRTVHGQRYASNGSPLAGEFRVDELEYYSESASVATAPDGGFVVVWDEGTYDPATSGDILLQRFASDGSKVSTNVLVNTYTTDSQRSHALASSADGDFIVAWTSTGSGGTDSHGSSVQMTPLAIFADSFESGNTSSWSVTVGE